LRQARELKLQDRAQAAQEAAAKGAEIDVREDLTRNEKMVAKLAAGMTLQAIAEQHGISRERVRQIIKAIKHRNSDSHLFAKLGSHPFAKLGLSTRAWKALESDGITTVDVLCSKTQRELLRLPNFGLKSLHETIGALARIGRKLGDNPIAPAELAGTATVKREGEEDWAR
jgi:DNA-directed RNA polymerase alpha subunit